MGGSCYNIGMAERDAFCDECRVPLYDAEVCRLWGLALCGHCWLGQFEWVWQRHPEWADFCPRFGWRAGKHCVPRCHEVT
jgi:hypothetical protein